MNIVCVICSELLVPSDDVYYTPCGHIFHFSCLQKWISRSNTCPQCREKTSARNIHRIYFNFSNDDSIVTDPITLQSTIDSQNFNLTLLKKEKNDLTERNSELEMQKLSLQQEVWNCEGKIKDKNSAILALKEQLKYCKAQCANVADKEHEIKTLNTKLKELQNVQTIINASANKVDNMIKEISSDDVCKLKTYISILKSELENSTIQKKQLREKLRTQNHSKLKQLEETLKNQDAEITHLQAKLLEMQTAACNCKCSETVAEVKNYVEECKESQGLILDSIAIKHTSNSCNGASLEIDLREKNTSADNAENTPQNIKSRGFFSMTNHNKRVGNNTTVPSILAKKMKFNELAFKKTVSRGMTFDGFGGHAKYDKFPNQFKNSY